MELKKIQAEDFQKHYESVDQASFMQTPHMADLLEKRGCEVEYLALMDRDKILVSALLFSLPMTGGLHMEIASGPIHSSIEDLPAFYQALKAYAKEKGALELVIKPYDTYQTFDTNGQASGPEQPELIQQLTDLGYHFDGLCHHEPCLIE